MDISKRKLLKQGLIGLGASLGGAVIGSRVLLAEPSRSARRTLAAPDDNGVRLLPGLRSRIIAHSSRPVIPGRNFRWHAAPDGGACFSTSQGGWIYVSNSEMRRGGGVGAIVFDAQGEIIDAYPILTGSRNNCAGGATPWGTWLSCEEVDRGRVFECDPAGSAAAIVRPALGLFKHEAVAVDTLTSHLYLTEDERDGCLYRFIASGFTADGGPDLSAGVLQVALDDGRGGLRWQTLPDPLAKKQVTRKQLPDAKRFNGGEGIVHHDGKLIFTTKGDNRVWSYDTIKGGLDVLYDAGDEEAPLLAGVDNVTVSQSGDIYVAEDGGDLQIVVLDRLGNLFPLLQLEGHPESEITGPAFSPDGRRLYFSSQRGTANHSVKGITYEINGF